MSDATYDDPSANPKDAVRFRIGDTDMSDPYLSDGEIHYCLQCQGGDVLAASLMAIRNIIAQLSYAAGQESVGPVSEGGTQGAIDALMRAYTLIQNEMGLSAETIFTGQTIAEKANPDFWATRSAFKRPINPTDPPGYEGCWPYSRWLVSEPVNILGVPCEDDEF